MKETKLIIVGGGLSGMTAALELHQTGVQDFLVLEARDRVGGRTLSQVVGKKGATMDLGGQWVGPNQKHVLGLAKQLELQTFKQRAKGSVVWDFDDRITEREFPKLDLWFFNDILRTLEVIVLGIRLKLTVDSLPEKDLFDSEVAKKFDGMTCEQYFNETITFTSSKRLAHALVRAIHGVEPRDLSLLQFLIYVKQNGGLQQLIDTEGGNQESKFVSGAQSLSTKILEYFPEKVVLGSPVRKIERHDEYVIVHTEKEVYKCEYLIMAMPPVISSSIDFQPPLPPNRQQMMQRNFMGSIIKYIILYDKAFWIDKGMSGEVVHDGKTGPIFNVFDDTRPIKNSKEVQPALVAFANADLAREWNMKTKEERKKVVLKQLSKWFGPESLHPCEFIEQNWAADEWSKGCPIATWGPGVLTSPGIGKCLREPIGRIHWCGTETATEGQGFLDGAVQSGRRVASEIKQALKSKL